MSGMWQAPDIDSLPTSAEVAAMFRVDPRTVTQLAKDGGFTPSAHWPATAITHRPTSWRGSSWGAGIAARLLVPAMPQSPNRAGPASMRSRGIRHLGGGGGYLGWSGAAHPGNSRSMACAPVRITGHSSCL